MRTGYTSGHGSFQNPSAGRLEAPDGLLEALAANDFASLAITAAHGVVAGRLPAHHSDSFDPMLVAQAQSEGLAFPASTGRFSHYEVEVLPVG
jgi:PIN domain nuclease of toxin-antitoxin system